MFVWMCLLANPKVLKGAVLIGCVAHCFACEFMCNYCMCLELVTAACVAVSSIEMLLKGWSPCALSHFLWHGMCVHHEFVLKWHMSCVVMK